MINEISITTSGGLEIRLHKVYNMARCDELCSTLPQPSSHQIMYKVGLPIQFWNYCVERRVMGQSLRAKNVFQLHGLNYCAKLAGKDGDISNIFQS